MIISRNLETSTARKCLMRGNRIYGWRKESLCLCSESEQISTKNSSTANLKLSKLMSLKNQNNKFEVLIILLFFSGFTF